MITDLKEVNNFTNILINKNLAKKLIINKIKPNIRQKQQNL